jgi:predicted HTH transcriptional regulator
MIGFDVKKNSGLGEVSGEMSGEMSGEIIRLMKNNPRITIPQLAETLATTTRTVERWIKALKLNNKIARQGSTKSGVWVVTIV